MCIHLFFTCNCDNNIYIYFIGQDALLAFHYKFILHYIYIKTLPECLVIYMYVNYIP